MPPTVLLVDNFLPGLNPGPSAELAVRLRGSGWTVHTVSQQHNRLLRLADMTLTAWRQRAAYDVAAVAVYSGAAFRWAEATCAVLRRAGKPYVLTLHGGNLPAFAAANPARVRQVLAGAAAVTAPSAYLADALRAYRPDLRVLPNPLDLAQYAFRLRTAPAGHLIWLRAFHAIYNPVLAVEALARLAADFPALRLTMVGPDKDGSLAQVQAAAAARGVTDRLDLPGGVPKADVPAWLDRGDLFINTTNVDNTPVSVMEAMACGLPVISTAVGGLTRLLTDEVDALLVPPDDAPALAAAIRRVLTEPGLAARLGSAARRRVEAFDWSVILPQWTTLLTQAAGVRAVPDQPGQEAVDGAV